jgi:type IV secretory pathway TrbF-like protein
MQTASGPHVGPASPSSSQAPPPPNQRKGANPYVGAERTYDDVTGIPRSTIAWQKVAILGLLAVVLILIGVVVYAFKSLAYAAEHPVTYAFGFDRVSQVGPRGNVIATTVTPYKVEQTDTADDQFRAAAASFYLPIFTESLFTVKDTDTDRTQLERWVQPFVDPGSRAETTIRNYLSAYNPILRKDQYRVTVIADPIGPMRPDGSYHITWTAKTYDLNENLIKTSRGGMTLGLKWGKSTLQYRKQPDGSILVVANPAGLYVSTLDSDQSLDPRASLGGSIPGANQ